MHQKQPPPNVAFASLASGALVVPGAVVLVGFTRVFSNGWGEVDPGVSQLGSQPARPRIAAIPRKTAGRRRVIGKRPFGCHRRAAVVGSCGEGSSNDLYGTQGLKSRG